MTVLGWIDRSHRRRFFSIEPFHKDFYGNIFISDQEIKKHNSGLHKIVRVALERRKAQTYEAFITEKFDSLDDPQLEMEIVAENHGFPTVFSPKALNEAEQAAHFKPGKRKDLSHCPIVTIDGETAKDFDDAISVEKLSNGHFNLKVSIADVSHYIQEGSSLDGQAFERATSIYFPNTVVPMLPEMLSNHLCSLVPQEPRLTLTCEMEINRSGHVVKSWIYPSTIKSAARLTYTEVAGILEGKQSGLLPDKVEAMLKSAHELSLILREYRSNRGGLDLDLPEVEMDVSATGDVKRIYLSERNEAHRLIEDFMIAANEEVSERIEQAGYESIFRVHETPDPLKIERLEQIIALWGFKLPKKNDLLASMQAYLDKVRGHRNEKILVTSLLRSLKQAQYSATNMGHFGLSSTSYCHFTSPIRRYPDLVVHRILRKSDFLKAKASPYTHEKLEEVARVCSERERRAFLAERDLEDMKKVRFMEQHVGKSYDGMVTSVKQFGAFVEIFEHMLEGLIPLQLLPQDYWELDELEITLVPRRRPIRLRIGDSIRIQVVEVNRLKRQVTLRYLNHIK